jgi:hypothetical protein
MSEVEFSDEGGNIISGGTSQSFERRSEPKVPIGVKIFQKLHLAKNETQARAVMILIAIVCFVITIFIYAHYVFNVNLFFWQKPKPVIIPPELLQQLPPDAQKYYLEQQQKLQQK